MCNLPVKDTLLDTYSNSSLLTSEKSTTFQQRTKWLGPRVSFIRMMHHVLSLSPFPQAMNFKELTGLSRSHVVEDFAVQLQRHITIQEREEEGHLVSVPLADLKECMHLLASGVLAREKECYQLYASYYEALLRSQYNQLYQKNRVSKSEIVDHNVWSKRP